MLQGGIRRRPQAPPQLRDPLDRRRRPALHAVPRGLLREAHTGRLVREVLFRDARLARGPARDLREGDCRADREAGEGRGLWCCLTFVELG